MKLLPSVPAALLLALLTRSYGLRLMKRAIGAAVASLGLLQPSWAGELPMPTAKVRLELTIARAKPSALNIDVYGDQAPAASQIFLSICSSNNPYGVSYDDSRVSQLIAGKQFSVDQFYKGADSKQVTVMDDFGRVSIKSVDLAERVTHSDSNSLKHQRGAVSVPKGGKSFAFSVALGPNTNLDESNVVIGQVVEDADGLLDALSLVPTSKEDSLGMKGGFAAAGRAAGDGRAKLASVDRPLKKIKVSSCSVESTASISAFMRR